MKTKQCNCRYVPACARLILPCLFAYLKALCQDISARFLNVVFTCMSISNPLILNVVFMSIPLTNL